MQNKQTLMTSLHLTKRWRECSSKLMLASYVVALPEERTGSWMSSRVSQWRTLRGGITQQGITQAGCRRSASERYVSRDVDAQQIVAVVLGWSLDGEEQHA